MSALLASVIVTSALLSGPQAANTGDVLLFTAPEGSGIAEVIFMGNRYPPVHGSDGSGTFFLLGVDLEAEEGSYPLTALREGGEKMPAGDVRVGKGDFPTEELTLPPKMVTPPPETLARIAQEREAAAAVYRSSASQALWKPPFRRPVDGKGSGNFGRRRILNGLPRSPHSGEDFSSPDGTPVRAAASGIIRMAAALYYSGNTILIDHGGGVVSQYFHLHDLHVTEGASVKEGAIIGTVGSTGRVTGPHLHFGVRIHALRVDPSQLLNLFGPDAVAPDP